MTLLLILILLALLWIVRILLKINENFVEWATSDSHARQLKLRRTR